MILTLPQIEVFMFILARIAGIFIEAPILSSKSIPALGKTALAIWITSVLWFVTPVNTTLLPKTLVEFIVFIAIEVTIGFLIGFVCNTIFLVLQSAGEFIDLQMGLSVAQSFDPIFGASISIIGRMIFFIALMVFLLFNGHHLLLSMLHQSFTVLPVPTYINLTSANFIYNLLNLGQILLATSVQLAGPVILVIFLSDFAFGIVSRVAPQVNVFMLGFQVKPALGLLAMLFTIPILIKHISRLLGLMGEEVLKLLSAFRL
ncbi:flagellar biosynthetic protein FliR [Candidatus Saganbacteria bacterium]|nr:flagellar biosynthetic protein FliR [Candidatus Saganbacteria bacterium]